MPRFDAFTGPSNTSVSPNITSELTMNWIPERNAVPVEGQGTEVHDKNVRCSLIRRPGLRTFVTLPQVPVRGVYPGSNRLFAVGGDHFYEIKNDGTIIDRSTPGFSGASGVPPAGGTIGIEDSPRPVLGFFNGSQIMLISDGLAYCDNGNGPVPCSQSVSLNDLVVDPAPAGGTALIDLQLGAMNTIILSPTYTFTDSDVGQMLTITSGTGFTPGTYTITALLYGGGGFATGAALLNTGAGTPGSTGGHGSIGMAGTPGYVLTTATGGAFDATDVGRSVLITGGVNFNVGLNQPIIAITANGGAVGGSAWGTPGASLGTGIEFLGAFTFTDLQLGGIGNILLSPSRPFVESDVGQTVTITSGTGFTPGNYKIDHILLGRDGYPTGNAYLKTSAGTPGSTGGHGIVGSNQITAFSGAFLDGYFFASPGVPPTPGVAASPTKTVAFSALDVNGGGAFWDPLDTFTKRGYPDNVIALFADHEELYTFGDLESTQVWRNTGNADNPFQPDPGAVMHVGDQAPFSTVRLGNGVAWIGLDVRRGSRHAYHATGYNPVIVSTPAVEAAWATMPIVSDAVAFTYADQGHELWVISFPNGNQTWVYDVTTGWWHQWGWWNDALGAWDRIRTWVHCVVALDGYTDKHFGGDNSTGQIYEMSTTYKTDDGSPIKRRRRAPHMTLENMRRFYARFEIDCDRLGQTRVYWNRLGNGRDRIWQMDTIQAGETAGVTVTLGWSDDATRSFQTIFSQTLNPGVDVELSNAYLNWTDATWH